MIGIRLTPGEVAIATTVAGLRVKNVLDRGLRETNGSSLEGALHRHVTGALGEIAVAKWLDRFWSPADAATMFKGDVGAIEVRAVEWEPRDMQRRLYIKRDDVDERRYILAVVKLPIVTLAGWKTGGAGKRPEWLNDPQGGRPVFFVPHDELQDMERW